MVDRDNPYDVIQLAEAIFKTLDSASASGGDYILKSVLVDHFQAENALIIDLLDALAGHEPCPLEIVEDEGVEKIHLRRTNSLTDYLVGLRQDETNPLDL